MKKITGIALVAILAILVTSCSKREHTCTCTYMDISGVAMKNVTSMKGTTTQARNGCNSHGSTLEYVVHTKVTCVIQ